MMQMSRTPADWSVDLNSIPFGPLGVITMPGCEEKSIICLRAVHAVDRSRSYAARLPYDVMENVTDLILRDQKSVCRVTYDLTPVNTFSDVEWQ